MSEVAEFKIPCEVYSRIVGYLRPVQNWNKGKRQEWKERKTYALYNQESITRAKGTHCECGKSGGVAPGTD